MTVLKKIYPTPLDCSELGKSGIKGLKEIEYISVEALKEWIKGNVSNEENQAGVKMIIVDSEELLRFIEEDEK